MNVLNAIKEATEYANKHQKRFEQELCEFLKIPSVSAVPQHRQDVENAAKFVKKALTDIGIRPVTLEPTLGHPIVYGERQIDKRLPTVLLYGHYDVQPVDPLERWTNPPFEPIVKNNRLYARGASDDKGQLYLHIKALEAILKTQKTLPVNVKILIEGEEEIGSVHLTSFLKQNKRKLKSDVLLISDTEMAGKDQAALTYSLRGIVYLEVEVRTGTHDLHSGMNGGAVLNAAQVLMEALAPLNQPYTSRTGNQKQRIHIADFYRDVKPVSRSELLELRKLSVAEQRFKKELGVKSFAYEKPTQKKGSKNSQFSHSQQSQYRFFERTTAEPSLDISGFVSGYTGEGAKTIVPSMARAKIGVRLVEHQQPKHILSCLKTQIRKNLEQNLPNGLKSIKLQFKEFTGGAPVYMERNTKTMQAASHALKQVYGKAPIMLRSGGSIPIVADFVNLLNVEAVLMGFGLKEDAIHSPNESFSLKDFKRGMAASIHFLHYLVANKT